MLPVGPTVLTLQVYKVYEASSAKIKASRLIRYGMVMINEKQLANVGTC